MMVCDGDGKVIGCYGMMVCGGEVKASGGGFGSDAPAPLPHLASLAEPLPEGARLLRLLSLTGHQPQAQSKKVWRSEKTEPLHYWITVFCRASIYCT